MNQEIPADIWEAAQEKYQNEKAPYLAKQAYIQGRIDERRLHQSEPKQDGTRIPFDLQRALRGDKLITRDAREVVGFYEGGVGIEYKYSASVYNGMCYTYTEKGIHVVGKESPSDLFMAE